MAQLNPFDVTPENEASKLQFHRRQFFDRLPIVSPHHVSLGGKTAVVTGANGGNGIEFSRQLLDIGLKRLILAVQNESKGEAARLSLMETNALEPGQTIEVRKLDFASHESVTSFTQRIEQLEPQINIAILNTSVNRGSFHLNPATSHEEDLQTKYLATDTTFARSFQKNLLLRSQALRGALLKAFDDKTSWDAFDHYATTKLLGQLFVTDLIMRVFPALAIINCANPGLSYGLGLGRELGLIAAASSVVRLR